MNARTISTTLKYNFIKMNNIMKKIFLTLFIFCTFFMAYGQQVEVETDNLAYNEGDLLINAGFSFGYYGYGLTGSRSLGLIPLTANLEYGFHEYISIGPYIGYASWDYDWVGADYNWSLLSIGGRGSFHYLPLLDDALDTDLDLEKLDFYVTLILGVEIGTSNTDVINNDTDVVFGPVLGFKYLFNPNIGVYLEGGRGTFGYGTLGVALKF